MSSLWNQPSIEKYKILHLIETTETSHTFMALDLDKNIPRTIKLLRPEAYRKGEVFERAFHNEIRIVSEISSPHSHPNIVEFIEAGHDEKSKLPYLVLEYLSGNDLSHLIKQENQRLTLEKALQVFKQMCEALEFIHSRNVVHLDLCPQNVRITSDGILKLMDFGQARKLVDPGSPRTNEAWAHPQYVAPEILDGKFDVSADIYSLGIVFYEILTREVPFKVETLDYLNYKIRTEIPEPVYQKNATIPKRMSDIIAKLIAKNPQDRYPNVGEVLKEINSLNLDARTLKTDIYERLTTKQHEEPIARPQITPKIIFVYSLFAIAGIGGLMVVAYLGWQLGRLL